MIAKAKRVKGKAAGRTANLTLTRFFYYESRKDLP